MPYKAKGKCVYKADTGKKVGCTTGSVKKYLSALHANVPDAKNESLNEANKERYTPEEIAAVIWNEEKRPGNKFFNWLSNAFIKTLYKNIPWGMNTADSGFVGKSLQKLGYSKAQIVDVRNVLVELAKKLTDYYVKHRGARNDAFGGRPDKSNFALYGPERWGDKKSNEAADSFQINLKKLFIKKLAQREDLLKPDIHMGLFMRMPNSGLDAARRISPSEIDEIKKVLRPIIREVIEEARKSNL